MPRETEGGRCTLGSALSPQTGAKSALQRNIYIVKNATRKWEMYTGLGTVSTNRCKVTFFLKFLRIVCLEEKPNIPVKQAVDDSPIF